MPITITAVLKLAIAMSAIGFTCMAQSTAPKKAPKAAPTPAAVKPKTGVVSGRIFAITTGGDLKPARLATAYLLFHDGPTGARETFGLAWQRYYLEGLTAYSDQYTGIGFEEEYKHSPFVPNNSYDLYVCKRNLLVYNDALLKALKWAQSEDTANRLGQIISTKADEDGRLSITNVPAGNYILLAFGRAGVNDAVWVMEPSEVAVVAGTETTVKAAKPDRACVNP